MTPNFEHIPVYVKAGALLPMTQPTLHTSDPSALVLTVRIYGSGEHGATLYEDDGGLKPNFTKVNLVWDARQSVGRLDRSGPTQRLSYTVQNWHIVKAS